MRCTVVMTVAALSVDWFLVIVKPHLQKRFMTLTIIIWILAAPLSIVNDLFNHQYSASCTATSNCIGFVVYVILLLVTIVGIILITSVLTFCFTCRFINNQSVTAGESVYASRKKRHFGIFGLMLIIYIICFFPVLSTLFLMCLLMYLRRLT